MSKPRRVQLTVTLDEGTCSEDSVLQEFECDASVSIEDSLSQPEKSRPRKSPEKSRNARRARDRGRGRAH